MQPERIRGSYRKRCAQHEIPEAVRAPNDGTSHRPIIQLSVVATAGGFACELAANRTNPINRSLTMSDPKPKTLDQARARITELEAQLAGKNSGKLPEIKSKAVTSRKSIDPASKSAVVAKLVASGSLAKLQTALNEEPDLRTRLHLLRVAEADVRAALKAEKDQVKQVTLLRDLQKVQKRAAVEMASDPKAWAQRYRIETDQEPQGK